MQVLFFFKIFKALDIRKRRQLLCVYFLSKLMAKLYVTHGFIGFGKTTFARNFSIQNNRRVFGKGDLQRLEKK